MLYVAVILVVWLFGVASYLALKRPARTMADVLVIAVFLVIGAFVFGFYRFTEVHVEMEPGSGSLKLWMRNVEGQVTGMKEFQGKIAATLGIPTPTPLPQYDVQYERNR